VYTAVHHAPKRAPLFSRAFVGVLVLALLGFGLEGVIRTAIPLIVLDRGGNALWVGAIAAAAALPSVLFRPYIGRLVDTWRHDRLLQVGTVTTAIGSMALLVPGLLPLAVLRFVQGAGWAAYSVANHALMAKLAPADRRGEASGYFMAMPAIATLVFPPAGVALYLAAGELPPLVLAFVLGMVAFVVSFVIRIPGSPAPASERNREPAREARRLPRILEPSAIPATAMVATFMAGHSLFLVFPPVYLAASGLDAGVLAPYYLAYGLVMTVTQLLVGRVSDRLGRAFAIRLGCAVAIAGFASALVLPGFLALLVASLAYATAVSLVSPTLSALTMDRAPAGRLGAAMATYSLGYQLATGASGIIWGAVIAVVGFPWPFVLALALQLVTIGITFLNFDRPSTSGAAARG
jgi:MFS family permease